MHTACVVKVAFIGAGSVEFTRNVVTDLCSFGELHGDLELSLHDIDAERLGYADVLAKRISSQSGAGATISSSIDPQAIGSLPPQLAALNRTFLNVVELTVKAVLEGDRSHVYQAALLDPNTAATLTTQQTRLMCDELLAAHGDLIPAALRL
jgi:alpha-galactosidase/6-phospho-beta-glucosidase family protein